MGTNERPTNPYEIAHGALDRLDQLDASVKKLHTDEQRTRWRNSGAADASGNVNVILPSSGAARSGYEVLLERIATTAPTNGELNLYVDGVDPLNLLEEITAPMRYTDAFSNNIWLPPGSVVVCHFTGMALNDICTVSIQVLLRSIKPRAAHYQIASED